MKHNISPITILIGIVILLWIVYFIQSQIQKQNQKEGFVSKIRPYIRSLNKYYDYAFNNYGPNVIINKLRKWSIL